MWIRAIGLVCTAALAVPFANLQGQQFAKYKSVEAYQISPGVLMFPKYADDGQVCQIGFQSQLYEPTKINVDAGLSNKEIDEVFDELVPASERGPKSTGLLADEISESGQSITTTEEFENVSL